MEVFTCPLPGHVPEELEHDSVVDYFENRVRAGIDSVVYCDYEPRRPDGKLYGLGFYGSYGIPYMSDPANKWGLYGVDVEQKRLIFDARGMAMHNQRDGFVFAYQQHRPYVKGDFTQLKEAFLADGYTQYTFAPQHEEESLIGYRVFDAIKTQ